MSTEDISQSEEDFLAIVATTMVKEFNEYFSREYPDEVLVFDNGGDALIAWRQYKTPYFFCDHAGLADGMTSFRLIRQIRNDDQGSTGLYVMSENLKANERTLAASHVGASGIVLRSPQAAAAVMGGARTVAAPSGASKGGGAVQSRVGSASGHNELEALFRKFVGPVGSQLINVIHQELGGRLNSMTFREYASVLADKIRTESMRQAFLDAVRALKK